MYDFGAVKSLIIGNIIYLIIAIIIIPKIKKGEKNKERILEFIVIFLIILWLIYYNGRCVSYYLNPKIDDFYGTYIRVDEDLFVSEYKFECDAPHEYESEFLRMDDATLKRICTGGLQEGKKYHVYYETRSECIVKIDVIED